MADNDIDKPIIGIDLLKFAYMKAKERMMTEIDALKNDLTLTFWTYVQDKISHRELIVIAVRGEVRTGKSTVVLKIVYEINKFIDNIGLNKEPIKNMTRYIFSDQTEFLRFITSNERNAALAIDEFNAMARTGLNATTEEALFEHYSDVFAGQYLHRVSASPDIIVDKNATIILDVIGKDEEKKVIRCKLIYRDVVTKLHMTIGRVDIYVGDITKNWLESGVREIVEKKEAVTPEDMAKVERIRKEDFYVRYQVKKYKRMDLLKKHGVRDIRDLEFATVILEVLNELQEFAKVKKVPKELINTVTDEVCKRNKRIYSILTVNEISQKSAAILDIFFLINQLTAKLKSLEEDNTRSHAEEKMVYRNTIEQAKQLLGNRLEEQKKYSRLYMDYMRIE